MTSVSPHPLWPPPPGSSLPEPLASSIAAYGLARIHTSGLWRPFGYHHFLEPSARWPDVLHRQLIRAARDQDDLRQKLLEHLLMMGVSGSGTVSTLSEGTEPTSTTASRVLLNLIVATSRTSGSGPGLGPSQELSDEEWLARWAALQDAPDDDGEDPTRSDLLGLRLAMGELDAIADVVRAAGGGSLRRFLPHLARAGATQDEALELDLARLAAAYPRFAPDELVRRTEFALWKRDLFGCLTRSDITSLGLAPAEHPCGIDLNASGTSDFLAATGRVLTGRDVAVPMVVEWGRHEFFDWGEDEEVLFFSWDRPALEAAVADPLCVKRKEVEGHLERL